MNLEQFKKDFPCFWRVSVKGIITNDDGDVLLCQEDNGVWNFPGGGIDHQEFDLFDCLRREVKEEMGLEIINIEKKPFLVRNSIDETPNANGFKVPRLFVGFKMKIKDLNFVKSDECVQIGFFNKSNLPKELFPDVKRFFELI